MVVVSVLRAKNVQTGGQSTESWHVSDQVDAPDTKAGSQITDHTFKPKKSEPWGLCKRCGLGQAAHAKVGKKAYKPTSPFRCASCITKGEKICPHK